MKRHLGPIESIMWRVGREALSMTVGNLMILDRSPTLATLAERLAGAAEEAPRLRWRPDDPTGTRTRPAWVEDAGFDPEQHVRTMAVASPGDQRQVLDLVALLECQPFPTHRPPWDVTLIEGLEGGRAALYLRAHHVVSDGIGGMALTTLLLDDPGRAPTPRPPSGEAEATPPTLASTARRLGSVTVTVDVRNAVRPLAAGVTAALNVDPVAAAVNGLQRGVEVLHSVSRQVVLGMPFSSLPASGSVTSHFEIVSVPGARKAALALGGSRNDLIVAAAAAGLGLYLERLGVSSPVLRLATPTCRQRGDGAGGNSFVPLRIEIPTASAHPGPHFGVVAARLAEARAEPALGLTGPLAAALSRLPNRLLLPVVHAQMSSIDFIATALPGLRRARTVAGAVVEGSYPFGPRLGSLMNVTAFGNEDRLDVGISVDPGAVSEPGVLLGCMVDALRGFVPEVAVRPHPPTAPAEPPPAYGWSAHDRRSRTVPRSGGTAMAEMAPSRRPLLRPQPVRRRRLGSLIDEATGLLQTVANEVAPGVVGALDVDEVVQRLDIEAVLDRVDLNRLLERVDVERLLASVDLNAVLSRLDLNALIATLDVDKLVARVDANKILEQVDVNALVERTELDSIIARSSASIAKEAVDAARSAGVGLDSFVHRWVDRVLRRPARGHPGGPRLLLAAVEPVPG